MPPVARFKNEADVKAAVKKLLKKHGWFYWMPSANGYGITGVSDFVALRAGKVMAIETKFGKNQPTPMQLLFLRNIAEHGGQSFVINEDGLEELERALS